MNIITELLRTCECGAVFDRHEGCEMEEDCHINSAVLRDSDVVWVICSRCRGEGTLRGWPGAYTESDRAEWSEGDYEDYANHRRTCEDCGGAGKVRQITDEAMKRPTVVEWLDCHYETEAIYRSERAMGA